MGRDRVHRAIMTAAESCVDWVRELRRDFHRHPEISGQEERTAAAVAAALREMGIETRTGVGGTGVVGVIRTEGPGVVGLRADMDALPMQQENDVEYKSSSPGVMHACGHDAHTAMLLGAARVLKDMAETSSLPGSVVLLFQPAEENLGGAQPMIEDGALLDPVPERFFAQHVGAGIRAGHVAVSAGAITAATDGADIRVTATGGHAAAPHLTPDPVVAACHVVAGLQTVVSRGVNPIHPAVVTVGTIHGGTRRNIIPPEVVMELTIRNAAPEAREPVRQLIERTAAAIASAHGCGCEISYSYGYPAVVNDVDATALVTEVARALVGEAAVQPCALSMGGEDFSYFAQQAPGCMWRLGTANPEQGIEYPIHNPRFDIDESALPVGVAMLAACAWEYLARRAGGDA